MTSLIGGLQVWRRYSCRPRLGAFFVYRHHDEGYGADSVIGSAPPAKGFPGLSKVADWADKII